jgi:hypothetical protein
MKENERRLILELGINKISEQEFIERFPVNIKGNSDYVEELLNNAHDDKNSDDVDYALMIAYKFNLITEKYIDVLCKLLGSDWHYKHEDIARGLQKLRSEKAVEVLYKTALTKFEYLDYDNSYSLARKCMWALGDIHTDKAIEKLKLLAESEDKEIKEYAIEQFNREKIKEKYVFDSRGLLSAE